MKPRALVGKIHLYLGLISAALLILVGLTGSIIVFEEELDRFLNPAFFEKSSTADERGEPARLSEVVRSVEAIRPGTDVQRIDFRFAPDGPLIVFAKSTFDGQLVDREFSVDPFTATVIGERSTLHFMGLMWHLHINLLLGEIGGIIVGFSAIILTIACITGLVLWWPRRGKVRQGFTIKRNASSHRFNIDLHRVTGIYLFIPLFVASFTGIVIVWPHYTFPALEVFMDIPEVPRPAPRPFDPANQISIDDVLPEARRHIPEGPLRTLHIPSEGFPFFVVSIRSFENGHPRGRSYVYIHPDTGETATWAETRGNTLGYQIRWEWLVPTHSGDILGVPGKVAILLSGVTPLVFTITGVAIWWRKRRARLSRRDTASQDELSSARRAMKPS